MIVPVRCDRCRQTAEEAGTEIYEGLCGNCQDELRQDADVAMAEAFEAAGYEMAHVGYTEDF